MGLAPHRLAASVRSFGPAERLRVENIAGVIHPTEATWQRAIEIIAATNPPEPPHPGTPMPWAESYTPCRPRPTRIAAERFTPSPAYLGAVA